MVIELLCKKEIRIERCTPSNSYAIKAVNFKNLKDHNTHNILKDENGLPPTPLKLPEIKTHYEN
jgi:hypothetical protein